MFSKNITMTNFPIIIFPLVFTITHSQKKKFLPVSTKKTIYQQIFIVVCVCMRKVNSLSPFKLGPQTSYRVLLPAEPSHQNLKVGIITLANYYFEKKNTTYM